jgi:predicted MFS family arabinose efflux permease
VPEGSTPDWQGAVLGTAALGGVIFGLIQAATEAWGSGQVLGPLLGGLALLAVFVARERTARQPLVPHGFFSNRTRVTANIATLFFMSAFFTVFFILTLFLQQVQHYSAIRTGLAYLPVGLAIGVGIGVGTTLLVRAGNRTLLCGGFLLAGASLLLLARIAPSGDYWTRVLPGLVVLGLGSGFCFVGFGNASVHGVTREDASLASGIQNAVQQVGGAVGLAVLVTIALRHATSAVHHGVAYAQAATDGYVVAYRISAVVVFVGAGLVALFVEGRPVAPESDAASETAGSTITP